MKNAALEGGQVSNPQEVNSGDCENGCDEDSEDGKEINPGRRTFFNSDVLAD